MTSLDLDASTTALVLIDLQKGIVSRTLAPHSADNVIQRSVQLARACRAKGGPIVAVHVAFSPDGADRLRQPVDEAMVVPPGGFPADWSDFAPEIAVLEADATITKKQWGAFHGTELDLQLRRRGVKTIILCGIATNFGVEMTAREAWQHGYNVVVAEDACSSVDLELHRFAIGRILPRISRVRSTDEVLAALSRGSG
jgi:nicotinamidase-related amidase